MEKNTFELSKEIITMAIELTEYTSSVPPKVFQLGDQVTYEKGFQTIYNVCSFISAQDFDIYSDNLGRSVAAGLNSMKGYFDNIKNSVPATSQRQRFLWFHDAYTGFCNSVNSVIPFTSIDSVLINDVQETKTRIEAMFSSAMETTNQSKNLKTELETLKGELDTLVAAAKTTAQDVIVTRFGVVYEDLSQKHKVNANLWLVAAILFVIGICGLSLGTLQHGTEFMRNNKDLLGYQSTMVIWIGSRLVFFSVLSVGLGVCISNYRANRHNQIMNKHRQNALSTFETFVKSSGEDPVVKDAILMEVTRTIFSPQATGFSSSESESQSKIVEIVKNISGSKD